MARDKLAVLWRLRDAAVTAASTELAAARLSARQIAVRLEMHQQQISREAAQSGATDAASFAAWLPRARLQAAELQAGLRAEESRVIRLQQALLERRTEAESVAKVQQRRRAEQALAEGRREQAVMDEAAGRRPALCSGG